MQLIGVNQLPAEPWQAAFAQTVSSMSQLLAYLELDSTQVNIPSQVNLDYFPLKMPWGYLTKIEKRNPQDPLLLQVLPSAFEFQEQPGYVLDPLQEQMFTPVGGVIHKYAHRVLLITTQACVINCRYCFRRHFPYADNSMSASRFATALAYIEACPELDEVILSGGDPFSLSDDKLIAMLKALDQIPHVKRIRFHSRLMAILPQRLTQQLLHCFASLRSAVVIVFHVNHPAELDDQFTLITSKLRAIGVHLLNQSVLLAHVNDNAQVLSRLSHALFSAHVLPYYLHLLDPVVGAHHFDVSLSTAQAIMKTLLANLPGYLVPKLVREKPGMANKMLVDLG